MPRGLAVSRLVAAGLQVGGQHGDKVRPVPVVVQQQRTELVLGERQHPRVIAELIGKPSEAEVGEAHEGPPAGAGPAGQILAAALAALAALPNALGRSPTLAAPDRDADGTAPARARPTAAAGQPAW